VEESDATPAQDPAQESAVPESSSARRRAAGADYKARLTEFVSERKQKRGHVMTPARIQRNRMISFKHGAYAKTVKPSDVLRYRLERVDPELPEVLDAYLEAQKGNLSALDRETAMGLAATAVLRRKMVQEIAKRGVSIEEPIVDEKGKRIGRRIKANPLLESLKAIDERLGLTVEQARLSKRGRGQATKDDAIAQSLARDARLREARKLAALPPADPELYREASDTKAKDKDDDEDLPS